MANFQWERLLMALGAVGAMQVVFEKTLKFAAERRTFGKPIGKHQAIRHNLLDEFQVPRTGHFSFAYNAEDDLVPANRHRYRPSAGSSAQPAGSGCAVTAIAPANPAALGPPVADLIAGRLTTSARSPPTARANHPAAAPCAHW